MLCLYLSHTGVCDSHACSHTWNSTPNIGSKYVQPKKKNGSPHTNRATKAARAAVL